MNKDYIYLIHKLAYEHMETGVSYPETEEFLKAQGIDLSDSQKKESVMRTFSQVFIDASRASIGFSPNNPTKFYMLNDAYFRYLEYLELVESRKNAEQAKKQALIALVVTLIALLSSIIIGIIQIYVKK